MLLKPFEALPDALLLDIHVPFYTGVHKSYPVAFMQTQSHIGVFLLQRVIPNPNFWTHVMQLFPKKKNKKNMYCFMYCRYKSWFWNHDHANTWSRLCVVFAKNSGPERTPFTFYRGKYLTIYPQPLTSFKTITVVKINRLIPSERHQMCPLCFFVNIM